MTQYGPKDVFILVDGYDLTAIGTEMEIGKEAVLDESTPYGATWATHENTGIKKGTVTHGGFYDDAANGVNAALSEHQGESRIMCAGFAGNTNGRLFAGFAGAMETKYDRLASRGKMHRANASYQVTGTAEDGRILHALDEETADGDTEDASIDGDAATDYGGAVYLQVTALTLGGYDDVTVTVRQSANDVDWEDLQAFTDVSAIGAERIEIAAGVGSIKQYLAVSWVFNGAGSDPSITFFVGAVRNAS